MPQITIIKRTGGGSREKFTQTTVTFGRDSDNMAVVGGEHTSRRHGELRYEDGQWTLFNLSPNGTEVNGRRVTTKPRPLHDHDVFAVGGETIFELRIEAPTEPPGPAPEAEPDQARQALSRRARLWLYISIYLVLFMGGFFFLNTLATKARQERQSVPPLTHRQIEEEIRRPLPKMPADPRQSQVELDTARELVNRLDSAPDATYRCHWAYKQSLALAGREHFEPGVDQLNYQKVRQRLIAEVTSVYDDAFLKLKSQRFLAAAEAFRRLTQVYPDPMSQIHKNARDQKRLAADHLGKRR